MPAKKTSPPTSDLYLENQLCHALYAASLAMTKIYRRLLAPLGLTYPQYIVLLALWQHRSLTAGALARAVALDSGTLVPLLRKLMSRGLVLRQRSELDERSVIITLTPAGQALQRHAYAARAQVACSTQYSEAQCASLTAQLQSMRRTLEAPSS